MACATIQDLLNDPTRLGAYATGAVAVLAAVSLIVNSLFVWAAFRQARASRRAAEAAEDSVELFRRELRSAERAAFPLLNGQFEAQFGESRLFDPAQQPDAVQGYVFQYGGTEPAREVEVVIRWRNYGVFRTLIGDVSPKDTGTFFEGTYAETQDAWNEVPAEFRVNDPATAAIVVIWTDPAGGRHWWAQPHSIQAEIPIARPKGHPSSGLVIEDGS